MKTQNLFYLCMLLYICGMGIIFFPSRHRDLAHKIGSVFAELGSLCALIVGLVFVLYGGDKAQPLMAWGSFWEFSLDRLSAYFMIIIGSGGLIASIYAYSYGLKYHNDKLKILTAEYNLFLLAMTLVTAAYNAFTFLLVWEIMAIASFLLVNHEQYSRVTWQAAYQYILMTNLGTAFIMGAFFLLIGDGSSLSYEFFIANRDNLQDKDWIFALALLGFAAKAGLVPLHAWLPKAHPIAPTHVSALMSGVMLKMAVYAFLRFVLYFMGTPDFAWGVATLFIGLLSGVVGALFLQMDTDIKKILAYSSIEHLGIIFAAIGAGMIFSASGNEYVADICYVAALVHSLNHCFIKTTLFLVAGSVIHAIHTRNIEHMGGLIRLMPITSACALIGSMSICALPFTAGFLGEWLLLLSLVKLPSLAVGYSSWVGILAMILFGLISALSLGGFVRFFGIIFVGKLRANINVSRIKEVPFMNVSILISTTLCVLSGFFAVNIAEFAANLLAVKFYTVGVFPSLSVYNTAFKPMLWSLLLVGTVLVLYKSLGLRKAKIADDVWSCGIFPTTRMQYSATGFSKPIRRVFSFYLQPHATTVYKQLVMQGNRKLFVSPKIQDIIADKLTAPINKTLFKAAGILRRAQAGSIQLYISYILITIICVLIYGAR